MNLKELAVSVDRQVERTRTTTPFLRKLTRFLSHSEQIRATPSNS
jgi:hypothetical protein